MSIPVNMYRVCVNKHFFFSLISFFLFELAIVTLLSLVERMSRIQKWWYHTHCGCKQCINILWWWYPHYGSLLRYFCIIGTLVSHKKKKNILHTLHFTKRVTTTPPRSSCSVRAYLSVVLLP